MTTVTRASFLLLLGAVLAWTIAPMDALGHGEEAVRNPEKGSTLAKAPAEVFVDLTEAPTPDAQMAVKDPCGKTVSGSPSVEGQRLVVPVDGGSPGNWVVSYSVVSSVDGHPTRGGWGFTVKGKKDCSTDKGAGTGNGKGNGNGESPDTEPAGDQAADDTDDGSSFPIVPVVAGTLALAGLALFIRSRSGG
jgi:methionine-rich copper-binding protein CopC